LSSSLEARRAGLLDALIRRDLGVALDHRPLDFHGASQTAELDDRAVAGALDDAAVMPRKNKWLR
jgi:hypothetical protein